MFHPEFAAIYTRWFVIRTNALPKLRHGAPSGVERMDYGLLLSRGSFLRLGIRISILTTQAEPPWRISWKEILLPISSGYNSAHAAARNSRWYEGNTPPSSLGHSRYSEGAYYELVPCSPYHSASDEHMTCSLTRLEGRILPRIWTYR